MLENCQLIVCDVDGCLADEAGGPLNNEHLAKIASYNRVARQRGWPPLTLCTGRPQPFAEALCRLLHNEQVPCVAENGVWLYHPGKNDYQMDPAITREHLEMIHVADRRLDDLYHSRGVTHQPGKSAAVTLYHPEPRVLREIIGEVQEVIRAEGWPLRVSMTWNYINCDLEHVTKGSGLARLFQATGIDPARAAGIGDTMSDVTMAETLGWFASPANASEDIKQRADYVSPYEETAGVLDILKKLAPGAIVD